MQRITVQVEDDQKEWADERVDSGEASNRSEVVRRALWNYMAEHGHGKAGASDSRLAATFKESAKYLFVAALTWLGVTVWFPFSYRTPALVLLLAAATCVLGGEVVQQYDVRPLAWLRERRSGQKA
jgi:Arc/MetJ-type ribon-helix-helix transcriptional regulator